LYHEPPLPVPGDAVSLSLPDRILRKAGRRLLRGPQPMVRSLAGAPITNRRGDRLDPAVQLMLKLNARVAKKLGNPDPVEARADFESAMALASPDPEPLDTEEGTVQGGDGPRRCITYRPPRSVGTLIYFHGGGWSVGSVDSYDPLCRRIARMGECTVISVDYRLAPEHPFPSGLNDALAAYDDVRSRVSGLVGVGGDSAGGNLSAVVARHRDPSLQLLIYPGCDMRRISDSYHELKHGFLLEAEAIDRYLAWYAADPLHPDASPLLGEPGRAPAIVATAGFDPLRDEGEQYARALREAGVPTIDLRFSHLLHGFANMDGLIPAADAALEQIGHALRHVWSTCDTV
jgi:acetyl esterase